MRRWFQEVGEIIDYGKAVEMRTEPNGEAPPPSAFVVRLPEAVPGSAEDSASGDHFVAFGSACTHMGCLLHADDGPKTVRYRSKEGSEDGKIHLICGPCPCHGTSFDLTRSGLVILGPATQNLPQLAVDKPLCAHGSKYDVTTGEWKKGPAPSDKPLVTFMVRCVDNEVWVAIDPR